MGRDVVAVMDQLGHRRFALVGHDRGARVGYRLALDQPDRLDRLVLLDILPTFYVWRQVRAGVVPAAHWDFLSRPYPQPEQEIARDPVPFFDGLLVKWTGDGTLGCFDPRALAAYHAPCGEADRIHAFCEDYRAGATVDLNMDEEDIKLGRTISCPVLAVWGLSSTSRAVQEPRRRWRSGRGLSRRRRPAHHSMRGISWPRRTRQVHLRRCGGSSTLDDPIAWAVDLLARNQMRVEASFTDAR
jgi:haloacetate dehalogenase